MNKVLNKIKEATIFFFKNHLYIIPLLLILDYTSKVYMESLLLQRSDYAITVIPNFFRLALLYNKGAAWGIFSGNSVLLTIVSIVGAILMIGYLCYKFKSLSMLSKISLYVMIPGCLGNLIDRAFYSERGVIDFLEFTFGSYVFPTFNIADMCLTIGIAIFLLSFYLDEVKKEKKEKENG